MNRILFTLLLLFGLSVSASVAEDPRAQHQHPVFHPYESIRAALVNDTIEGVAEASKKLAEGTKKLAASSHESEARKSLEAAGAAASSLAKTSDLDVARKTFGKLSDALVDYRNALKGERPFVAYCSMAKKHWLQPEKKIGNPYYGQSMASCGEIVADSK